MADEDDPVVEEIVERIEKLEEENRELRQKLENQQNSKSRTGSQASEGDISRRKFLKMLGMGAGGLALSSSAAGLTWSKITPQSQGTSDIKSSTVEDGAITSSKISDSSVSASKLSFDTATQSELDSHTGDTTNPHNVTDNQTGAASALSNHAGDANAHHSAPTFASNSGTIPAGEKATISWPIAWSNVYAWTPYRSNGLAVDLTADGVCYTTAVDQNGVEFKNTNTQSDFDIIIKVIGK